MITAKELEKHIGVLPYDSELFGVYQSLLGWKSKRALRRFGSGLALDQERALDAVTKSFRPQVKAKFHGHCEVEFHLEPGTVASGVVRRHDSHLMALIAQDLPPMEEYDDGQWEHFAGPDRVRELLEGPVPEALREAFLQICQAPFETRTLSAGQVEAAKNASFLDQLNYESSVAGTVLHLVENKEFAQLKSLFYAQTNHSAAIAGLLDVLTADTAGAAYVDINSLDPRNRDHLASVGLSPISVVHLFRQYFFEFDSFLGTPVGHVWLSPGSQVELIEVSTRRQYVERVIEEALETTLRSETTTQVAEELSTAVKDSNRSEISFGATADANQSWIGGEFNASATFDMASTQEKAREETYKRTRSQSEKVSTEIRKSFKSTFRMITETTDTSSKRYLLNNSTKELVNYEMRRKMRQVGVQVQDVGTYLCWQTYVDDPGRDLGLGELIHIAKEPDVGALKNPEELPLLAPFTTQKQISIPFQQASSDEGDKDEGYRNGREVDTDFNEGDLERIAWKFRQEAFCDRANYSLANVTFEANGESVEFDLNALNLAGAGNKWTFDVVLAFVNFRGKDALNIGVTLHWEPASSANDDITNANKSKLAQYNSSIREAYEKEFVANARDRVTLASKLAPRPYEDLRAEERIVVYRALVQDLLTKGVPQPDDRTRHVVAELINAIFDVDKMLYFVSPEWWRPRLHRSGQELGPPNLPKLGDTSAPAVKNLAELTGVDVSIAAKIPVLAAHFGASTATKPAANPMLEGSLVGWGGVRNWRRDNYYITDESAPARLGASLGWLLQLDGDNLRNAFLNAPWVKAVLPIRPGMEEAALNWLTKVEGTNGIGDDDVYRTNNPNEKDLAGNPLNGQKMLDVLHDLAKRVALKHAAATKPASYPEVDEGPANPVLVDAANTVTATPIDRVYEHGFYPLVGGFRNKSGDQHYLTVDQWVEILPTDQVVPVPVEYDPKTGRMV